MNVWMVAEGYAVPEMRRQERVYSSLDEPAPIAADCPRIDRRRRKDY